MAAFFISAESSPRGGSEGVRLRTDRPGSGKSLSLRATIAKPKVTLEEAIEQIDIGGPSMIRSAAKNYESVTVMVDPADYDLVLETCGITMARRR